MLYPYHVMKSPLISVIIPVYKVEPYLTRCLSSVCTQTYRNLDIICVDDGSPDRSIDILNDYAARDSRILIIRQPNQGQSAARNAGMSAAKGEWLTFVDSDDWLEAKAYESCVPHLTDEVDMVLFGAYVDYEVPQDDPINAKLNEMSSDAMEQFCVTDAGRTEFTDDVIMRTPVSVWNKLFRTSVIREHQITFPIGRVMEDYSFTVRAFLACRCGHFLQGSHFYHYVKRIDSITYRLLCKKGGSPALMSSIDNIRDIYNFLKQLHMERSREMLLTRLANVILGDALMCVSPDCRETLIIYSQQLVRDVGIAHHTEYEYISTVNRSLVYRLSRLFYRRRLTKREWGLFGLMIFAIQNKNGMNVGRLFGIRLWTKPEKEQN